MQLLLDEPREETRSNRQCSVVEIVIRVVHGAAADRAGNANIDKGTGAGFEHVSKVLCRRNETSVAIDVRLADEIGRGVGDELCLGRIIEERAGNRGWRSRQRPRRRP